MGDPIGIGNCIGWWDADDATTIHATGSAVDSWDDKSGNGRTMTALTTARPATGTRTFNTSLRNVFDFDGTTDVMTNTTIGGFAQSFTVGIVFAMDIANDGVSRNLVGDITNGRFLGVLGSTNQYALYCGSPLVTAAAGTDTNSHYLIGLAKNQPNAVINVNGTETTGSAGNGSWAGGVKIGAGMDGRLAEVVIYSVELNSTNRTALGNYFSNKWFTAPSADPPPAVSRSFSVTAVHRAANY